MLLPQEEEDTANLTIYLTRANFALSKSKEICSDRAQREAADVSEANCFSCEIETASSVLFRTHTSTSTSTEFYSLNFLSEQLNYINLRP